MEEYLKIFTDTDDTEFEVRFGTVKNSITKIDFNKVVQKLKSLGFYSYNSTYSLKIQSQFTDIKSGETKMSSVRTEIDGLSSIKDFCKNNKVTDETLNILPNISFVKKNGINRDGKYLRPIDFNDLNFRVSIQEERELTDRDAIVKTTIKDWDNTKKTFRLLKRSTFLHKKYALKVDLSIVKSSKKSVRGRFIPEFSLITSDCLNSNENYEIEIECLRKGGEPGIMPKIEDIKKTIRIILSGLQSSNFPIGNKEMTSVKNEYYELIKKTKLTRKIYPKDFIGPASISLEMENIQETNNNILSNYVVTEKADGSRKLLYVSKKGHMYVIDTNMNVQYTGIKTNKYYNTIIDGEHIIHNKKGEFLNLYAAFDIYFIEGKDVRDLPFFDEPDKESRLKILTSISKDLIKKDVSVFQFSVKTFYDNKSIFESCNIILDKEKSGLFEYETDGLIFTPASLGVGQNKLSDPITNYKKTWMMSYKWKPPEYNTVDFLITTQKDSKTQNDIVKTIFERGISTQYGENITSYKTLVLRVGYDETKHGFLNPCEMMLNESYKEKTELDNNDKYKPVPFYPTEPYDDKAHLCNIILDSNNNMLIENNTDKIDNNTIVEFRYDGTRDDGFKWIPIRVRHDKTAEFRSGQKNFGNAYHVAQSVWQSIHNPITKEILSSGKDIPENVNYRYYKSLNSKERFAIRDFHNLGIKKRLIQAVSKPGNSLIDLAVGKGGDLSKWIGAKLDFVLGIDVNRDNIENRINGACSRYLNYRMKNKSIPKAIFLNGDASLSIMDGKAFTNESSNMIVQSLFGKGPKDEERIGKLPLKLYGKYKDGFDVVSCQFALHYFFENEETLHGFLQNVADTCKVNGYFIGTCFDGKKLFNILHSKGKGEGICKYVYNKKICEIIKEYERDEFNNDSSCLGYGIKVYQESIDAYYKEYLVNFDYLDTLLEKYGFKKLSKEELKENGMTNSVTSFETEFLKLKQLIDANGKLNKNYGNSLKLNDDERFISFLNNMFVYKKINRIVVPVFKEEEESKTEKIITPPSVAPVEQIIVPKKKRKSKKKKETITLNENIE